MLVLPTTRKRGGQINPAARKSFASILLATLEHKEAEHNLAKRQFHWPSQRYANDPVGFVEQILGGEVWSKLRTLLEAINVHDYVAVRAGQKLSKSYGAMAIALWWYCTRVNGVVRMTSSTGKQIEGILYSELLRLLRESGICIECKKKGLLVAPCDHSAVIDRQEPGKRSLTGIRSADMSRLIQGFTAATPEDLQGFSGANQLWILDESAGIEDEIYEAARGNLAGGGKMLCISNPTKTRGFFYEIFNPKIRSFFETIHISALESPNYIASEKLIPGLATRDHVERIATEFGESSAIYKVRVLGEFAAVEEGSIFGLDQITLAEQRNLEEPDLADPASSCVLSIGLDPAGPSGRGDDSALIAIRGKRMLRHKLVLGWTDEQLLELVLGWLKDLAKPGEIPYVSVDREGAIGARVYATFKTYAETHKLPRVFWCRGIRASDNAQREPKKYRLIRDELAAAAYEYIRDGGGIVENAKLEKDMLSVQWVLHEDGSGLTRLISKEALHKILARSPDSFDALCLAAWNSRRVAGEREARPVAAAAPPSFRQPQSRGADLFRRR